MKTQKNILLIEDDHDDQLTFKEVLKKCMNAQLLHVADNGKEALDWLNTSTNLPDLIFSDINMPVMNGIECFTEILKSPSICKIPVVFLSSDTSAIDHIDNLGAKTFIKKGSDDATLQIQIERVINMELLMDSFKPLKKNYYRNRNSKKIISLVN